MSQFRDRLFPRLALIGVALVALTLAGCGRTGPLDPPPGASMASEPASGATPAPAVEAPVASDVMVSTPGQSRESARAVTPVGPNKRIFLDNLLN